MDALLLQFLAWVSSQPRTYAETMDAWRTTCPRMPIWEDAVSDGLVELKIGGSMRDREVALTPQGRASLERHLQEQG